MTELFHIISPFIFVIDILQYFNLNRDEVGELKQLAVEELCQI